MWCSKYSTTCVGPLVHSPQLPLNALQARSFIPHPVPLPMRARPRIVCPALHRPCGPLVYCASTPWLSVGPHMWYSMDPAACAGPLVHSTQLPLNALQACSSIAHQLPLPMRARPRIVCPVLHRLCGPARIIMHPPPVCVRARTRGVACIPPPAVQPVRAHSRLAPCSP